MRFLLTIDEPTFAAALGREVDAHVETVLDEDDAVQIASVLTPDVFVVADDTAMIRRLRKAAPRVPILAVARDADHRFMAIGAGADDAVVAPVIAEEIVHRCRRLASAPAGVLSGKVRVGPIAVDMVTGYVEAHDAAIDLSPAERRVVVALAAAAGRAVGKESLFRAACPNEGAETKIVDVHITRIRRKLGAAADHIRTEWGVGYMLTDDLRFGRSAAGALAVGGRAFLSRRFRVSVTAKQDAALGILVAAGGEYDLTALCDAVSIGCGGNSYSRRYQRVMFVERLSTAVGPLAGARLSGETVRLTGDWRRVLCCDREAAE